LSAGFIINTPSWGGVGLSFFEVTFLKCKRVYTAGFLWSCWSEPLFQTCPVSYG
jgi:hypothetical protein